MMKREQLPFPVPLGPNFLVFWTNLTSKYFAKKGRRHHSLLYIYHALKGP